MPDKRPDILLIILDTLRRDRLSAYGHRRETSPAFDSFAAESTLFERAVAPAQWTIPSHASMFTGLYPSTHQVVQAHHHLSGSHPTLAEILQVEGYRTVGFCNNPLVGVLNNGLTRGFGEFYNYAGAAPNRPQDVQRSAVRRALATRWRRFAMAVSQSFAHSDALFRFSLHPWFVPLWTRYVNYKGHTERSVDDLIDTLKAHHAGSSHGQREPLFAFLNLMGTHLPYRPPSDYLERYAPEISRDKAAYRFMGRFNADASRWASPADPPLSEWERHVIDGFYDAELAYQDAQLRRLLTELETSGALDNTLVIIAADHGEGHGEHDFFGHSFVVYQELVHVPLVIHYPQSFPQGKRIATNVSTRRIFHTVLDAVGVQPPLDDDDPNADVSRLSLVQALNGRPDSEKGLVFAEAFPPLTFVNVIRHRNPALIDQMRLMQVRRGVYQDSHKLAVVSDQVEGLFNVSNDPQETHDLSAQQTTLVRDLQQKIGKFVETARLNSPENEAAREVSDDVVDNLRALGYLE
jgi:uncharacterized sulfatase